MIFGTCRYHQKLLSLEEGRSQQALVYKFIALYTVAFYGIIYLRPKLGYFEFFYYYDLICHSAQDTQFRNSPSNANDNKIWSFFKYNPYGWYLLQQFQFEHNNSSLFIFVGYNHRCPKHTPLHSLLQTKCHNLRETFLVPFSSWCHNRTGSVTPKCHLCRNPDKQQNASFRFSDRDLHPICSFVPCQCVL